MIRLKNSDNHLAFCAFSSADSSADESAEGRVGGYYVVSSGNSFNSAEEQKPWRVNDF